MTHKIYRRLDVVKKNRCADVFLKLVTWKKTKMINVKKRRTIMAKVKNFKTIFPAVSVPLNDDYSINEEEFRTYLRWIKSFYGKGIEGLVCNGHTGEITGLSREERKRVVEICSEVCGDCMTIILINVSTG